MKILRRFEISVERAFSAAFVLALTLPLCLTFFSPGGGRSYVENRMMATRPGVGATWESITAFPAAFDSFLNDNFGFRTSLVALHFRLASWPLRAVIRHEALVGKKGWLFWGSEEQLVDVRGDSPPYSLEDIRFWQSAFLLREAWLKERGSGFLLVAAPDKPSIYPEYLPDGIRAPGAASALDQLTRYYSGHEPEWFLNLKPVLLRAKATSPRPLYYAMDSHWNPIGAYWAFRAIADELGRRGYRLDSPIRPEDIVYSPADAAGEFLYVDSPDRRDGYKVVHPVLDCIKPATVSPEPGLPRLTEITEATTCDRGRYRVVVIKDSFVEKLKPYFSSTFARVVYLNVGDQRFYSRALIEREHPDFVIYETVERRLRPDRVLWEQEGQGPVRYHFFPDDVK